MAHSDFDYPEPLVSGRDLSPFFMLRILRILFCFLFVSGDIKNSKTELWWQASAL